MPYNTSAIIPPEEATGTTQLPVSRIKKMINLDQDINASSSSATFLITLATEMFIQYMAEQGHNIVMSEKKPRKGLAYKDLASAVSRQDNLEFLSDIVPKTVPFSVIKAKKPKEPINPNLITSNTTPTINGNGEGSSSAANGHSHPHGHGHNVQQSLINGVNGFAVRSGSGNGGSAAVEVEDDDEEDVEEGEEDGEEDEGPEAQLERENKGRRVSNGDDSAEDTDEDVEMN